MDGSTLFSVLEIPLVVLSPVQRLKMEATRNVSVPVMQKTRVAPGRGLLIPPLPIVEEFATSRGDRKHALRRAEMAWSVVPCPLPAYSRLHHRMCLEAEVAQLLEVEVSQLRL